MKAAICSMNHLRRVASLHRSMPSLPTALFHSNAPVFKKKRDDDEDATLLDDINAEDFEDEVDRTYKGGLIDASKPTTIAQAMHLDSESAEELKGSSAPKEFTFTLPGDNKVQFLQLL